MPSHTTYINKMKNYTEEQRQKLKNQWEHRRIKTKGFSPSDAPFLLKYVDSLDQAHGICYPGSTVVIAGPPKSRKSTLVDALLAGHFVPEQKNRNLGFQWEFKTPVPTIIHIDTEQPEEETQSYRKGFASMCGYKDIEDMPGFYSYNTKGLHYEKASQIIKDLCFAYDPFPEVIIVDHSMYMVKNYMDDESIEMYFLMMAGLQKETGVTILNIIHTTKDNKNAHGNLGSRLFKDASAYFHLYVSRASKYTGINITGRRCELSDIKFTHERIDEHTAYPLLIEDEYSESSSKYTPKNDTTKSQGYEPTFDLPDIEEEEAIENEKWS